MMIVLVMQLATATAVPARPSPEDALRVLLSGAARQWNMTGVVPVETYGPAWFPPTTGSTWKQPFSPEEFRPLGVLEVPGIRYRLPRGHSFGKPDVAKPSEGSFESLRPRSRVHDGLPHH